VPRPTTSEAMIGLLLIVAVLAAAYAASLWLRAAI
jgi:hypothetical protein